MNWLVTILPAGGPVQVIEGVAAGSVTADGGAGES
jgi:hypothetical protein